VSDVSDPSLPAPAPPVTPETKPFWDATAEGRLVLPRCRPCGTVIWYPRAICPACHAMDVEWIDATGRGTIYSFTVIRRSGYAGGRDYVLAYVELAEGPKIMTNIVDYAPEDLVCGRAVEVVFHDTGHGSALPRFKPSP
jgi:uncharacterized OB-fold protein